MNWIQLGYQYIIGGLFFFVTLLLCFRPGASELGNPSDRRTLHLLLLGLAGYFAAHTGWILLASS